MLFTHSIATKLQQPSPSSFFYFYITSTPLHFHGSTKLGTSPPSSLGLLQTQKRWKSTSSSSTFSSSSSSFSSSSSTPIITALQHPSFDIPPSKSPVSLLRSWFNFTKLPSKLDRVFHLPRHTSAPKLLQTFETHAVRSSPNATSLPIPQAFNHFQQTWLEFFATKQESDPTLFKTLCQIADLRFPENGFPETRQMKREIVMHVGPTNSGKTHQALNILENAKSGAYCGPLRLLAKEVCDKLNHRGTPCNLITGEERHEVPNAAFTSYTVEMLSLTKPFDVVVIDEIQMLGDPQRGWAWCQALLGVKAHKLIVCGEVSSVPLVKALCARMKEPVTVTEYDRLGPLQLQASSLHGQLARVQKGDAVVVFARNHVFQYQSLITAATQLRCAVVYGSLPPECRAAQAKLFNENKVDVLVSTDAIGMGLNLNIQRIVITSLEKFNGRSVIPLSLSSIKQIAGRAGRFGMGKEIGWVTTLVHDDFTSLKRLFVEDVPTLTRAGLQPTPDQIEAFSALLPYMELHKVLELFEAVAQVDLEHFFLCSLEDLKANAKELAGLDFPIRDRFMFTLGPVNTRCHIEKAFFKNLATHFAASKPASLPTLLKAPTLPFRLFLVESTHSDSADTSVSFEPVSQETDLRTLEKAYRVATLYLWLSHRFPMHPTFASSPETCLLILKSITQAITSSLGLLQSQLSQPPKLRRRSPRGHAQSLFLSRSAAHSVSKSSSSSSSSSSQFKGHRK